MEKLEYLSALEIGRLVNERKVTPTEVILYFKDRIERLNPSINAFTYTKFDEALVEAKKLEEKLAKGEHLGIFAGVPFALKDFLPSKKGWTSSRGGVASLISVDEEDSTFCEAMEKEGAIAIGKTNAPAFGFRATTDNKMYGPTATPFNTKYNAGGSSGGSAAAVAAGLVPIAEGGDAGGSIRIPASYNNLFGFKPSLGMIPHVSRPDAWSASHPYCVNGALTKTVEDSVALFNVMHQIDYRDPFSFRRKKKDYLLEMNKGIEGMKIAFTYDFDIYEVDEEIKEKVYKTALKLKEKGVSIDIVHFDIGYTALELSEVWCKSISIDTAIEIALNKKNGFDLLKDHKDELPKEFIRYNKEVLKADVLDYYHFNKVRTDVYDAFEKIFDNYDIIISPTMCIYPPKNNTKDVKGPKYINGKESNPLIGFAQTFLVNFSGHPAASVPAGIGKNHLPIGLQVIGKRFKDEEALRVSKTLEEISPWDKYYKYSIKD